MSKKAIWISYDLGIKGDFPGLYAWLDDHEAKEAGNSVAFVNYEFHGTDEQLLKALERDLEKHVKFKPGDRIYVTRIRKDKSVWKPSGRFIIGNRKAAPWEGYGQKQSDVADGDE